MKRLLIAAFLLNTACAEQLRIAVYGHENLPANEIASGLRRIFRQSGFDIVWEAGLPNAEEASVMLYAGTPAKGRQQEALCRARRDIALSVLPVAPPGLNKTVLGMSQPLAPAGLNIRVFDDRVREVARSHNVAYPIVLAHVIAHEIGHVLLRSREHAGHGLMGDVWTGQEYDGLARGSLSFTAKQLNGMRATLAGTGCPDRIGSLRSNQH